MAHHQVGTRTMTIPVKGVDVEARSSAMLVEMRVRQIVCLSNSNTTTRLISEHMPIRGHASASAHLCSRMPSH